MEAAVLGGAISQERWESYRKLAAEARRHEALSDPLAAQERKRKLKQLHKAKKELYREKR